MGQPLCTVLVWVWLIALFHSTNLGLPAALLRASWSDEMALYVASARTRGSLHQCRQPVGYVPADFCSQKWQFSLLQTVSCVPVLFALLSLRMSAMSSITTVLSSVGTESGSLTMSYRHALDHIPTQSSFVQG